MISKAAGTVMFPIIDMGELIIVGILSMPKITISMAMYAATIGELYKIFLLKSSFLFSPVISILPIVNTANVLIMFKMAA